MSAPHFRFRREVYPGLSSRRTAAGALTALRIRARSDRKG